MNRSGIEWTQYTVNPVKGLCPMACKDEEGEVYCYAHKMYKNSYYHLDPTIRWEPEAFKGIDGIKRPSMIFVGSTFELLHPVVKKEWLEFIFHVIRNYPQHTFQLLTKCYSNLVDWSPFPKNCWVGGSCTNPDDFNKARQSLEMIQATVRFISFEPLLKWFKDDGVDHEAHMTNAFGGLLQWVIVGARTKPFKCPPLGGVKDIATAALNAGVPLFLKDNLEKCLPKSEDIFWQAPVQDKPDYKILRQEFPKR